MSDLASLYGNVTAPVSHRPKPVGRSIKRVIDVILALSAIAILLPLLLLFVVAVALQSSGPVFFRHRRVGFQGRTFGCLKFRTMVPDAEERLQEYLLSNPDAQAEWASTRKLKNDPRVTMIGSILRKTSMDELPQLFNVLAGDMSIVGPRPVTQDELVRYSNKIDDYLACRPGITGLWQVSGRSTTSYAKRVGYDAFYAHNWSVVLDVKIMLVTLPALLGSETAY